MSNKISDIEGVDIEELKRTMPQQAEFFSKIQSIDLDAIAKLKERLSHVRETLVSSEMMDKVDVESDAFKNFLMGENTSVAANALKTLKESTKRVDDILKHTLVFINEAVGSYWKIKIVQSSKMSYPSHDRLSGEIKFSLSKVHNVIFKISISYKKKIFTISALNSINMEPLVVIPGNIDANQEDIFEMQDYVSRIKYIVALFFALTHKLIKTKITPKRNIFKRFKDYKLNKLLSSISPSGTYVFLTQETPKKEKVLYIDVSHKVVDKSLKKKIENFIGSDTMIVVSRV